MDSNSQSGSTRIMSEESDSENNEGDEGPELTVLLDDVLMSASEEEDNEPRDDEEESEEENDDELPPILEPPSTGYLHAVNINQPPPELEPATAYNELMLEGLQDGFEDVNKEKEKGKVLEVVDLRGDSEEGSSTTDSDDELVNVDYINDPPEGFKKLLKDYKFLCGREQWMYTIKNLYKKQPTRIKRLLKVHKDAEGNPVEEPFEVLFEKIHAEREQVKRAQNVKTEKDVEDNLEEKVASAVDIKVKNTIPKLTHVMYPANVVNVDKAVNTLGGIGTISKILDQPNKKLSLKFRPQDPFANGINAPCRNACGLLISVKRRKFKPKSSSKQADLESARSRKHEKEKINLDKLGQEPLSMETIQDMLLDNHLSVKYNKKDEHVVTLNDKKYSQDDLLMEDKLLHERKQKDIKMRKGWRPNTSKEYNLSLPKVLETKLDTNIKVETLGIVRKCYEFNGICDFQYLPVTKNSDGNLVSIKDKIFPLLGTKDTVEKLVMKDLINEEIPCQTFSLPPAMSRVDSLPRSVVEDLIISDKTDCATRKLPPDDSVFSNRMKRIIYTLSYNFQADASSPDSSQPVPSQPLGLALRDIERRQIKKDLIENVRHKFEERPIWSKVALEFATKIPSQTLKYIIPNFAYFASNGPWRNTWIKFGLDPRKNAIYVIYQSVDFRIPFIYRRFMNLGPKNLEANHKFLPEHIPPKTQTFYQLCDIKINEITNLIQTLEKLASTSTLHYDERFGFLKEGSYEYFRYIMNYYLENLLQEHGKIPNTNESTVTYFIPPGHIEPEEKVKAAPNRRIKVKRIRRKPKPSESSNHSFTHVANKPGKSKAGKGGTASLATNTQNLIEDVTLNNVPIQSEKDELFDDEEEDEDDDDDYGED